ncbi:MAG: patatin-like phospholipase family protein [Ginsengibacter sp.]
MSQQAAGNKPHQKELVTEDFTNHPDVIKCMQELEAAFPQGGRPFIVSDVLDVQGNQYVNLVQKGGGVLGVALVGYTYVLEKMGIRFLRLAGTSAGAINTALMTVIGKKEEAKSINILKAICDLNFFNLVDGHPAARWIIKNFITHHDFTIKAKKWITGVFMITILLLAGDIIFLGLEHIIHPLSVMTKLFFVLTGFYFLLIGLIIFYSARLFKRLKSSGYGINPGNFFYDWIKQQLISNDVHTVSDLNQKATTIPELHLRVDNPEGVTSLKGDVTFITSELVTKNKIQFPEMCYLFREKANIDTLQPAGFIRASMSIPVFFESYMINNIPCSTEEIKKAWMDTMNEPDPPSTARFVDGGMLSNFPINIFHNPKVITPRLPSFGIDLDDSKPDDTDKNATGWSLAGYFGRMFNTIRFYYDKDFLLKNKVFGKGIGKIPLSDYNWLNFFITDQDKIDMFILGVKTATKFLIEFDWETYKDDRATMQVTLNKESGAAVVH